ncbi:hypothetical protein L0F63_006991 [Massospora cicadina]|nr:hypothetical protein L0F63_006991 [Massospora cicadina]
MVKLEKEDLYANFKLMDSISTSNLMFFDKSACFILIFINKELEMCNITHADLIKQLIEMSFGL